MLTLKNDDCRAIGLPIAFRRHGRDSALAPKFQIYHKSERRFNLRLKVVLLSQETAEAIIRGFQRAAPLVVR